MSRHIFACPLRWGDLDAQGHLNNAAYLELLQEARVDFLLAGPPAMAELLATGVLVVAHQVEYLEPVGFGQRPVAIGLWVDAVGASRFVVGYEVHDEGTLVARARTAAAPYDLAASRLRRLRSEEREVLLGAAEEHPPLRPLARHVVGARAHRYPLRVRWSDQDTYAHINNVRYFDFVQEARIALMAEAVGWSDGEIWAVVRQDLEYLRPLDFRREPYAVLTSVAAIGTRSFTLAVRIEDPATSTPYATARTVVVGSRPLTAPERQALARWLD